MKENINMSDINTSDPTQLYLELLKLSLTNWIHGHEEWIAVAPPSKLGWLQRMLIPSGTKLFREQRFDANKRENGQDWPAPLFAQTMIGVKRLNNLQYCVERVIKEHIPGDLIETGVWKGGSTIFMRGILKAYGDTTRKVWVADSFQGLPAPNPALYPEDIGDIHHTIDNLRVSEDAVKENFQAYGLLDSQVKFLKGWFKDTLPTAPIEKLAVLRLDGDMYESTMDAFVALYEKLSLGGYVIIDDYCIESCRKAVHDFRKMKKIEDEIIDIDGSGVFWKKS
jgi:O-methyltransferase